MRATAIKLVQQATQFESARIEAWARQFSWSWVIDIPIGDCHKLNLPPHCLATLARLQMKKLNVGETRDFWIAVREPDSNRMLIRVLVSTERCFSLEAMEQAWETPALLNGSRYCASCYPFHNLDADFEWWSHLDGHVIDFGGSIIEKPGFQQHVTLAAA